MSHRVLVTDQLAEEGLELLRAEPGLEVVVASKLDPAKLKAALAEADGIVIRSGTQLTAEVLRDQPRLKAIVRAGVGVDNIDVPTATRQGIVVMNTPGGNTVSTAEHTMALILALSRNVAQANDSLKAGRWDRNKFTGTQLGGKTLGIVGLGRVGLAVARRAQGLRHEGDRVRPVPVGREGVGARDRDRLAARRPVGPVRLHHAAHPALGGDPQPDRPRGAGEDEARRPHHQLRPGRADRRARPGRGADERAGRRGRHRRLRPRAPARRSPARGAPQGPRHAAPRRLDRGGAGLGRRRGRAAPGRLLRQRPDPVRREHADARPRRARRAAALPRPRPSPGDAPRADGPRDRQAGHDPLSRRGRHEEHPADHRQLRRRLDGVRARRTRSTSSTPRCS